MNAMQARGVRISLQRDLASTSGARNAVAAVGARLAELPVERAAATAGSVTSAAATLIDTAAVRGRR